MNKILTILSLALCLLAMACSGTVASPVQCETSADCTEGCAGYDSATCSVEGYCYCNDLQEDRGCDLDTDCTDECIGAISATCDGGACICAVAQCVEESDCNGCGEFTSPECLFGTCYCHEECPFIDRAELVTAVITAIDGLNGFQTPATPTFDDVPADAPFFNAVEAAVQLGIVSGYTDASGNLTGLFGPYDLVNRAAMIKIVVNAFAVPTTLFPGSPFPDVPSSAWFHDYVLTAYNQNLFVPPADGLFHPSDKATSCFMNEVFWRAAMLQEGPSVMVVNPIVPTVVTVSPGTSDVNVLFVDLTASADVTVRDTLLTARVYDGSDLLVGTADEGVYALLKNLKVINIDFGTTLQGPITTVDMADRNELSGQVWYSKVLSEDYDLTGGQTRHLAIRVDVDPTFPVGYSFDVEFSLKPEAAPWTSYVKDMAANQYLDGDDIIGDPLMSNLVTVQ